MTAQEASNEAIRRIRAARKSGQHWLDLGDLDGLEELPAEVATLTHLRELGLGSRAFNPATGEWVPAGSRSHYELPLKYLAFVEGLEALHHDDLCRLPISDIRVLYGLPDLHWLDLSHTLVDSLCPLAKMPALQTLHLEQTPVSDLTPLANCRGLKSLNVSRCGRVRSMEPLRRHPAIEELSAMDLPRDVALPELLHSLPRLNALYANTIPGMPGEVQSATADENCWDQVRGWWDDLGSGEGLAQERMIILLGNRGAGKTQLLRLFCGDAYDPGVPTRHWELFGDLELVPDTGWGGLRARVFDPGLQDFDPEKLDFSPNLQALSRQRRAIFIVAWCPATEGARHRKDGRRRRLRHSLGEWLEYVRAISGREAAVIIAQTQCDRAADRRPPPLPESHRFATPPVSVTCSAKTGDAGDLLACVRKAARRLLRRFGRDRLPTTWVSMQAEARLLRQHSWEMRDKDWRIGLDTFKGACALRKHISQPGTVLTWLHRTREFIDRNAKPAGPFIADHKWAVRID